LTISNPSQPGARTFARHSLSWRITVTIIAIGLTVIVLFGWTAYRLVEMVLLRAGGDRAQTVTTQIADLLDRNLRQNREDLRLTLTRPELRALVEHPEDPQAASAFRTQLAAGPAVGGIRRVEIWNEAGARIFEFARTAPGIESADALPHATRPTKADLSPLQAAGDVVFTELSDEIHEGSDHGQRLGFVVVRATIAVNPDGAVNRLIGTQAVILLGNRTGDVWTDLVHHVAAPPIDLSKTGPATYTGANGEPRFGALAAIRDSPFAVWVDFPRTAVVAPARSFLGAITMVGVLLVVTGGMVIHLVLRRMTTPLVDLTSAAESIAAGNYSHRAPEPPRRDEIGRLADSFNTMAAHVQATHQGLEAQVRHHAEAIEALRSSEARNRAIVDVAFDSFITIDERGLVTDFNPAAERTFGYRREDALGRELATLIVPPRFHDAHRHGLLRYLQTGVGPLIGKLIEIEAMRADGKEFPVEIAITEIKSGGAVRMFTGVVRDITARRMAEAALVESERAFRSTFDDAPLGIAQVSVDGRWIRVNRHLESILGWKADELAGHSLFDIFHPDDLATGLHSAMNESGDREERVRRKDGQFVWVRLTISPVRSTSGEPRHLIVILEDVSERRRLEERLRESEKLEAIGRLAGGVAHDFNNLLTAIIGYAQLLADSIDHDDPKAVDVDEIIKAAERSAALTGQLLAFSRKQVLVPAILDINALVRETAVLLRRVIGEHIDLVTVLAPNLDPVSADRTQLEQIVINLAVNARDAMPSGGRLTIETANVSVASGEAAHAEVTEPGHYVMLTVSDTGIGMDADTKLRVFEPFFTTKEQGRGTGLGLATVYGIVKQSGGFIGVFSEPLEGATFRVYLPAVPGATAPGVRREIRRSHQPGNETILVVEDERAVRTMTRLILERAGYQVVEAAAPDEAREIFHSRADEIDLMISDVVMPGAHGPALFKQLAVEYPGLRVLYMSGYTDDEVIRAGRLEGGENFMEKPFTSQKLLEKVREILDT
jgi:PAS domain S-box-containing protein